MYKIITMLILGGVFMYENSALLGENKKSLGGINSKKQSEVFNIWPDGNPILSHGDLLINWKRSE